MVSEAGSRPTGISLGRLAELAVERTGGTEEMIFEGRVESGAARFVRSCRFSAGLRGAGLVVGDRVVVHMANCPEVGIAYHGVWRAGGVVTPTLFLLDEAELRHVLVDSGARFVVTTPEFLAKASAVASGCPQVRAVIVADDSPGAGGRPDLAGAEGGRAPVLRFADLEAGDEGPLEPADPGAMAALLYTGGTTGRARGVVLSHDALSAGGFAALSGNPDEELAGLLPLPLSHVYGLTISVMALHARKPGPAVLMRWFDPRQWLRLVAEHRVALSALVPSMIDQLLAEPLHLADTSSLRRITSGGAPLPREIALEWRRRLPGVELVEGYGCTESAGIITTSPPGAARLGSVGLPAPGVELSVELPDGAPAGPGQDGEICVRGPMLMTGYWQAPRATADALRGGWLRTGDVGRRDGDGYLFVVDRIKDLIIRGGVNVYPSDVEDGLLGHPDVASCGVVGRADHRHGEEVVAYVQLVGGGTVSPEELVRWGRARLGPLRYPREVHIIESLPLTSALKTDRRALRSLTAASSVPRHPTPDDAAPGSGAPGADGQSADGHSAEDQSAE
ncbi:AMP-binding protein [Frankia sp. AiPs1]|uniref:class I adenylate-forming enzyme family protein n=1 Tax=Frankia sp. AiPs1 TaxID=573493 RepID=UPI002044367B|nr:AMP-binding protein [Frankia sp. AiPs1]MCM3925680.1 AMP-binding protein [Frankia sp. AiPs1]